MKKKKKAAAPALPHRVKVSPVADLRASDAPTLPPIGTVSLEGLVAPAVTVTEPTEDELLEEYTARVRQLVPRKPRAAKEPLEPGDDVTLDLLAVCGDELVPFSFRREWTTPLLPSAQWPGLFEQLVGLPVGESTTVKVTLPADTAVKSLANREVSVTVVVHAADALELPKEGAEAAFALLGLGATFDETLRNLYPQLAAERAEDATGRRTQLALEAFAKRWTGAVPTELLDAELEKAWAKAEGQAMVAAGLPADLQRQALAQWKADPATRAEFEQHLRLELALRALGEAAPPQLTKDSVLEELGPFAEDLGFTREQLASSLTADKALTEQLAFAAFRLALVRRVLASVKFG